MRSEERPRRSSHTSVWLCVSIAAVGFTSIVTLGLFVYKALLKVRAGQGLETYRTPWLVEFNWIGFLVFFACTVVALLVGFAIRWLYVRRERAQWQELEEKYGPRSTGA